MKTITVTKDIISKYETNDIVHYLLLSYKNNLKQLEEAINNENWGSVGAAWANIAFYTNILNDLDKKLNGDSPVVVV